MQQNENSSTDENTDTTKEQEGVEIGNTQEEVTEEVVENLDTRDSNQLPKQYENKVEVVQNSKFSTLPSELDNFALVKQTAEHLTYVRQIAEELVKSKLCPFKEPEDAILAIITGQQYNFPYITSINNIYSINGRTSMSTHLHRALLLQHKIMFKKIYNYEPIYKFVIKKTKEDGIISNIPVGIGTLAEKKEGWIASLEPVDRITKYKFTRIVKQIDGTFEKLEVESEFKLSDAIQAGLIEKEVWIKYTPRMLDARAFTIGSREIASDILLGIYSISELAEINNIDYTMSPTLEESVVYTK